jgi:uracil-DNA glycosylase
VSSIFFNGRLGSGREEWIRGGFHYRRKDGSFTSGGQWVRFWASAQKRATEALGRPAIPGRDYAMTEVVRCKSLGERGVTSAARHCPDRYLDRTLSVANAGLLICFGTFARDEVQRRYNLPAGQVLVGPLQIAGRERYVVFLPHPNRPLPANRPEKKKLIEALTDDELSAVQSFLREVECAH